MTKQADETTPAVRLGDLTPYHHEVALVEGRTFGPGNGVRHFDLWAMVTNIQIGPTYAGRSVWKINTVEGEAPPILTEGDGVGYRICARPSTVVDLDELP